MTFIWSPKHRLKVPFFIEWAHFFAFWRLEPTLFVRVYHFALVITVVGPDIASSLGDVQHLQ